jgi:hypothetical protein
VRTCSAHGGVEKGIQNLGLKAWREDTAWKTSKHRWVENIKMDLCEKSLRVWTELIWLRIRER